MAKLSEETQAIIDRLKAEGNLLRNNQSGNSIKSLKVDLSKFQTTFTEISTTLSKINIAVGGMVGKLEEAKLEAAAAAPTAESAAALGLSEEYIKLQTRAAELSIETNLAEEEARKEAFERQKQEDEDKRRKERGEKNLQALKENTISGQLISNPMGFLSKVLKGALIGFVGFNVLRGVIDEWTGGAMTEFIEGIDWQKLGEGVKGFAEFLGDNRWLAFATVLSSWLLVDFGVPLAVAAVGEVLRTNALVNALAKMTPGAVTSAPTFLTTKNLLRGAALTAVGAIFMYTGEKLSEYIRNESLNLTKEEIEKANILNYDTAGSAAMKIAGYTAGGATIGTMFGWPYGTLVGAILGFAYGLGAKLVEIANRTTVEKMDVSEFEENLQVGASAASKTILEKIEAGMYVEGFTDEQGNIIDEAAVARLRKIAKGPSEAQIQATNKEMLDILRDAERKVAMAQKVLADEDYKYELETDPYNEFSVPQKVMVSPLLFAERKAKDEERLAKAIADLEAARARIQRRVDKGLATSDDFVVVPTEGIGEFIRNIWENDKDRLQDRRDKFLEFMESYEGPASQAVLGRALELIEQGKISDNTAITIIRQGDSQTNIDASDRSSNSSSNYLNNLNTAAGLPTG